LVRSLALLQEYEPRASFSPPELDLTACPYMWPYCTQPLYHSAMPVIANVTILNGRGVAAEIVGSPLWRGALHGDMVEVAFDYDPVVWPWAGSLGLLLRIPASASTFRGRVEGVVEVTLRTLPAASSEGGGGDGELEKMSLPVRLEVIPPPPRERRLLWDQFHNLRYPSGYFPRDALWVSKEPFDWNADHPHTNFKDLFDLLVSEGYYVEVLGHPFTCFDAANYAALLVVDPEEEFFEEEIAKLYNDVHLEGLSVLLLADWYNEGVMEKLEFFDENTQQWWQPVTGGSNLPAVNDLLAPFDIAFGDRVYDGNLRIGSASTHFASGNSIQRWPGAADGRSSLLSFLVQDQSVEMVDDKEVYSQAALLGVVQPTGRSGRLAVFGDSSCVDGAHRDYPCLWLALDLVNYAATGVTPPAFAGMELTQPYLASALNLPVRPLSNRLRYYSKVMHQDPVCRDATYRTVATGEAPVAISWGEARYVKPRGTALDGDPGWLFNRSEPQGDGDEDEISVWYLLPYVFVVGAMVFLLVLATRRDILSLASTRFLPRNPVRTKGVPV